LASVDEDVAAAAETPSCAIDPILESFGEDFAIPRPTPEWERARPRFAAHIAAWRSAWDDACTTEPADERERGALELQRSCLQSQARKLVTILELLQAGSADPDEALRSVPAVRGCEGERLGALRPVPDDPELRAAVEALRVDIGEAQVEQEAGLLVEADLHATELVARARALGYAPSLADALYLKGTTVSLRGEHDVARTILIEAAEAAAAGGHDVVAAEAWIFLMAVVGLDLGDVDRAKEYASLARATLERLGDAPVVPEMQIRWELHHGQLLAMENDYRGALAAFERGLALAQMHDLSAVDQLREAIALVYLSLDRIEDSVALHRVVHQARLEELGDSHPRIVLSHLNLSAALHAGGRYEEALQHTASAVELAEELGMSHSDEAMRSRLNRIEILRMRERYEEALVEADELREIFAERGPLSAVLAPHLESNAALVYFDLRRYEDAVAVSRRGLELAEQTMPDAEVTNFLRMCLADGLAELGETEEALVVAERAVRVQRGAAGADPLYMAVAEQSLGHVLLRAGRMDEAVAQLERSLALFDALENDRGAGDWAKAQLAQALWETGQRERSRSLAVEAYPELDAGEREELGAWARKRGVRL
jgi:tetratricopeptide (TPR) repeat protein